MTICVKVTSDPGNLIKIEADEVPFVWFYHEGRHLMILKKDNKTVAVFDVAKLDGWWELKEFE